MKSAVMRCGLFTISMGIFLPIGIASFATRMHGENERQQYFLFFAGLMLLGGGGLCFRGQALIAQDLPAIAGPTGAGRNCSPGPFERHAELADLAPVH